MQDLNAVMRGACLRVEVIHVALALVQCIVFAVCSLPTYRFSSCVYRALQRRCLDVISEPDFYSPSPSDYELS